jgi:hypothetical protein
MSSISNFEGIMALPYEDEVTFTYDKELGPGYFIQVATLFWRDPKFSLEAKGAYTLLLSYAGAGATAWPGQERMMRELAISERALRKALEELQTRGLVSIKRRGLGKTNAYHIRRIDILKAADKKIAEASEPYVYQT